MRTEPIILSRAQVLPRQSRPAADMRPGVVGPSTMRGQDAVVLSRAAVARSAQEPSRPAHQPTGPTYSKPLPASGSPIEAGAPTVSARTFGQSDLDAIQKSFGARVGDNAYSEEADANGDGVIDFRDYTHVLANWGRERA